MTGVLKEKFEHRDVQAGRKPCEDEGRVQGHSSTSIYRGKKVRRQPCHWSSVLKIKER